MEVVDPTIDFKPAATHEWGPCKGHGTLRSGGRRRLDGASRIRMLIDEIIRRRGYRRVFSREILWRDNFVYRACIGYHVACDPIFQDASCLSVRFVVWYFSVAAMFDLK